MASQWPKRGRQLYNTNVITTHQQIHSKYYKVSRPLQCTHTKPKPSLFIIRHRKSCMVKKSLRALHLNGKITQKQSISRVLNVRQQCLYVPGMSDTPTPRMGKVPHHIPCTSVCDMIGAFSKSQKMTKEPKECPVITPH